MVQTSTRPDDQGEDIRPLTSGAQDAVTTAAGLWMVVGLFTDGWAHLNLPGLETFFTPWHAVLYSGFAVAATWIAWLGWRERAAQGPGAWRWPRGYRLSAVGVVVFGVGGLGDMAWHVALGVEVGIEALLSPTHLVLLVGGMLVLSSALRAGWARRPPAPGIPRLREELPAVLSLTSVTALAAFFLIYASVFTLPSVLIAPTSIPEGAPGHEAAEMPVVAGLAAYVITTTVLLAPLLLAQQVGRRPRWAAFLLIVVVTWLSVGTGGWTRYGVVTAAAVTIGAALVELLWGWLGRRPVPEAQRLPALGAVLPASLWTAQLAALAYDTGLAWPPELWAGVIGLSTLTGVALAVLVSWRPRPFSALEPASSGASP